jgi:hypothetical protein
MKDNALLIIAGICLLSLATLSLSSCAPELPEQGRSSPKMKCKIIMTGEKDSNWVCGSQGFTIVQFEDGVREKWCGIWGKPGDEFAAAKVYRNIQ